MYQQPTKPVQQWLCPYCNGGNSMDMYVCQWCHRKPPEPHGAQWLLTQFGLGVVIIVVIIIVLGLLHAFL